MKAATDARTAALYLLWLADQTDDPFGTEITPLKLQKLLYYAQGWALSEWDKPLFGERIEAWREGPVVADVYASYQGNADQILHFDGQGEPDLDNYSKALLRQVLDYYGKYSSKGLAELSHDEAAFIAARSRVKRDAPSKKEIGREQIKLDFDRKIPELLDRLSQRSAQIVQKAMLNRRRFLGDRAG